MKTSNSKNYIDGCAFEISDQELKLTDVYEVDGYVRVLEILVSGKETWVYVANS